MTSKEQPQPFYVKAAEGSVCGGSKIVEVFNADNQKVGQYERNYDSFEETTFYPFEQNGRWFALYSRDYTATRIMELPSCEDLGGEEPDTFGFCPVQLFVPIIRVQEIKPGDAQPYNPRRDPERWAVRTESEHIREDGSKYKLWHQWWPTTVDTPPEIAQIVHPRKEEFEKLCAEHDAALKEWSKRNPYVSQYAKFGFVAGCVWGDDNSWKIEFLDLSRASEGILVRDCRFGYIELPHNILLKDAIRTSGYWRSDQRPDEQHIYITEQRMHKLSGSVDSD